MVKELIGAKADVNVKDDDPGNTALLWAADTVRATRRLPRS